MNSTLDQPDIIMKLIQESGVLFARNTVVAYTLLYEQSQMAQNIQQARIIRL
jgi:hypothetical protein